MRTKARSPRGRGGEPPRASVWSVPFRYVHVRSRLGLDFARDDGAKYRSAWFAGGRGRPPLPVLPKVSTDIADLPTGAPCRRRVIDLSGSTLRGRGLPPQVGGGLFSYCTKYSFVKQSYRHSDRYAHARAYPPARSIATSPLWLKTVACGLFLRCFAPPRRALYTKEATVGSPSARKSLCSDPNFLTQSSPKKISSRSFRASSGVSRLSSGSSSNGSITRILSVKSERLRFPDR